MTRTRRAARPLGSRSSPSHRPTLRRGVRPVGASGADPGRSTRRTTLTGRAAILAAVIAVLAVSLAYPIRQYVGQRAEIAQLNGQVEDRQRRVAELEAERERWRDPAYVRTQARERLHYCMPDETCYVTVEGELPTPARSGDASR